MNSLFHYLYKCNKRSIAIFYFVFITFSLLLLFHVKGSLKIMNSFRQDITLAIFLIVLCMASFSIFLLALSSFNKTIKKFYDSLHSYIISKKYICKFIFFHTRIYYFASNRTNFFVLFFLKY